MTRSHRKGNSTSTSSFRRVFSIRSFCSSKKGLSGGGPAPQDKQTALLRASSMVMFSLRILSFSARSEQLSDLSCCVCKERSRFDQRERSPHSKIMEKKGNGKVAFIRVLLFWNQNLICRGSSPRSRLSFIRCFSSGCGHTLNILTNPKAFNRCRPRKGSQIRGENNAKRDRERTLRAPESAGVCAGRNASSFSGPQKHLAHRPNPSPLFQPLLQHLSSLPLFIVTGAFATAPPWHWDPSQRG